MMIDIADLVPSKLVNRWVKRRAFSDWEKAAIIFNSGEPLEVVHSALTELAGETQDEVLQQQISERFAHDAACWELFSDNRGGSCFYAVKTFEREPPWGEGDRAGHYADARAAIRAGKEKGLPFTVTKHQLADRCPELILPKPYFPPRFRPADMPETVPMPYDGAAIGEYRFAVDGLVRHWSEEIPMEGRDRMEAVGRFETRFVPFDNPFDVGEIVCSTDDPNRLGIVTTTADVWCEFLRRARLEPEKMEYDDCTLRVDFLEKDGTFCHGHVHLTRLEDVTPNRDDPRAELLYAAGSLLWGGGLERFSIAYRDYVTRQTSPRYPEWCVF